VTVEGIAIFGDVGEVALMVRVLTGAIDVANLMLTNGVLRYRIDELDPPVGDRKRNLFTALLLALGHLLHRLLRRLGALELDNIGRAQVLKQTNQSQRTPSPRAYVGRIQHHSGDQENGLVSPLRFNRVIPADEHLRWLLLLRFFFDLDRWRRRRSGLLVAVSDRTGGVSRRRLHRLTTPQI
jgi:hypothetical protein